MHITREIEFSDSDDKALRCIDDMRTALRACNLMDAADSQEFRRFAVQGTHELPGIYGLQHAAIYAALDEFGSVTGLHCSRDTGDFADTVIRAMDESGNGPATAIRALFDDGTIC